AQHITAVSPAARLVPKDRGAHSEADAERGEAVASVRSLLEAVCELRDEADAGRRERMAAGDPAAVGVEARVVGCHADAVAPGQHLHGERLVQLEEPDV